MDEFKSSREVAFGNGSRPKGFLFATVEFSDGGNPFLLHRQAMSADDLSSITIAEVVLNDGVEFIEFKNALANPNHTQWEFGESISETPEQESDDWRLIQVDDVDEWSRDIRSNLTGAGLQTLGDVETHINENEGLESISDLGPRQQETVIETLSVYIQTDIGVEL